jgi:hypothetical protein
MCFVSSMYSCGPSEAACTSMLVLRGHHGRRLIQGSILFLRHGRPSKYRHFYFPLMLRGLEVATLLFYLIKKICGSPVFFAFVEWARSWQRSRGEVQARGCEGRCEGAHFPGHHNMCVARKPRRQQSWLWVAWT